VVEVHECKVCVMQPVQEMLGSLTKQAECCSQHSEQAVFVIFMRDAT